MAHIDIQLGNDLSYLIEQKQYNTQPSVLSLWDQLTLAQEFSACSLGQFGYILSHIEESYHGKLAVLTLNGKKATISGNGYINVNPSQYN